MAKDKQKKRRSCGSCEACTRPPCGECNFCKRPELNNRCCCQYQKYCYYLCLIFDLKMAPADKLLTIFLSDLNPILPCLGHPLGHALPGPLKCFCASPHQIFAKSASQNARNRDKADFTTKVRKLRIN